MFAVEKKLVKWRRDKNKVFNLNCNASQQQKGERKYFFNKCIKISSIFSKKKMIEKDEDLNNASNKFRSTCRLFKIAYEGDFRSLCTVTF